MGLAGTVTAGVVSALGRSLPTQFGIRRAPGGERDPDRRRAQPGQLRRRARRRPRPGGRRQHRRRGVGLGLAVPINEATRKIISSLMSDGRVRRAYIGIVGGSRPLPPKVASSVGRELGIEVVEVVDGSPAARAGLRAEDLIVSVDGRPVSDVGDLQRLMVAERIGAGLSLELVREGRPMTLELVPQELQSTSTQLPRRRARLRGGERGPTCARGGADARPASAPRRAEGGGRRAQPDRGPGHLVPGPVPDRRQHDGDQHGAELDRRSARDGRERAQLGGRHLHAGGRRLRGARRAGWATCWASGRPSASASSRSRSARCWSRPRAAR